MNYTVTWQDIAIRLAAAVIAGGVIGFDRGARGRVVGLRTMVLMCLAACGAMIEANLMLVVVGKTSSSFTVLDALRFPLGILSGIGFIGAGAIVRRDKLTMGITTAATIWVATVIGLVLGGGYLGTGAAMVAITVFVLTILKKAEKYVPREHRADITIRISHDGISDGEVYGAINSAGHKVMRTGLVLGIERVLQIHVAWWGKIPPVAAPNYVGLLAKQPGVTCIEWQPEQGSVTE
jgi:putative Mg2+ transporter-C (MgtC) family protein